MISSKFAGFLIGQLKTENAILRNDLMKYEPPPIKKFSNLKTPIEKFEEKEGRYVRIREP
jgi:hypothetical protein